MPDRRFSDPPITEVVCGVFFAPADGLDPVLVGRFWDTQRERFPRKQLQPAIVAASPEGLVLELSPVPQLRTWLLSEDDTRVMQIQADRFYLNWRSRGGAYPSFNRRGEEPGLLVEVLAAFSSFQSFMRTAAQAVEVVKIEMSMIDVLKQGRHFGDARDLARVIPVLGPLLANGDAVPIGLSVVVEGSAGERERRVVVQRARMRETGEDAIRIETTARLPVRGFEELEPAFKRAHDALKAEFDLLIPAEQHHRFDSSLWRPDT